MSVRLAVFASGGGTNLQALLDHFGDPETGATVALVVSDRPQAGALDRAAAAGVRGTVLEVSGRSEAEVASATLELLERERIELVALAGYLRLVPAAVVRRFAGRMVNVHPALLPAFGGKGMYGERVHRAVLESGARLSGPTVHLVDARYDEGRIIAQWPVPVFPGDSATSLAERVLRAEHALYPQAVEWLATVLAGGPEDPEEAVLQALRDMPAGRAGFRWGGEEIGDETGIRRMLGMD